MEVESFDAMLPTQEQAESRDIADTTVPLPPPEGLKIGNTMLVIDLRA